MHHRAHRRFERPVVGRMVRPLAPPNGLCPVTAGERCQLSRRPRAAEVASQPLLQLDHQVCQQRGAEDPAPRLQSDGSRFEQRVHQRRVGEKQLEEDHRRNANENPSIYWTFRHALHDRVEEKLSRVHVPTLVVRGTLRGERVAEWMVSQYPQRRYPAVAIGSSNGALVHLYTALGIPWLPQTFLIPMARWGVHPDEPKQDLEWGLEPGRRRGARSS